MRDGFTHLKKGVKQSNVVMKRLSATAKELGPGQEAFKDRLEFIDGNFNEKMTLSTADKAIEKIKKEGVEDLLIDAEAAENKKRRLKYKANQSDRLDLGELFNELYKSQCEDMPRQRFVKAGAGTARLDFQNPNPYFKLKTEPWKPPLGTRSLRSWTTSGLKHKGGKQGILLNDEDSDFDDKLEAIAERANRGEMIKGLDDLPKNNHGYNPDASFSKNLQSFLYRYVGYEVDDEVDETGLVTESSLFREEHDAA